MSPSSLAARKSCQDSPPAAAAATVASYGNTRTGEGPPGHGVRHVGAGMGSSKDLACGSVAAVAGGGLDCSPSALARIAEANSPWSDYEIAMALASPMELRARQASSLRPTTTCSMAAPHARPDRGRDPIRIHLGTREFGLWLGVGGQCPTHVLQIAPDKAAIDRFGNPVYDDLP